MRHILRYSILAALLPIAAACASNNASGGPDWSAAQIYNAATGRGDRGTVRVLGDAENGYEFRALLLHTTRADPDSLERQRILGNLVNIVTAKVCTKGSKQDRLQFSPDNYQAFGHFSCTTK